MADMMATKEGSPANRLLRNSDIENRQIQFERHLGSDWLNLEIRQAALSGRCHVLARAWLEAKSHVSSVKLRNEDADALADISDSISDHFNLAREMDEVEQCPGWMQSGIIDRLKNSNDYRDARFEVRVASDWLRRKADVTFIPRTLTKTADLFIQSGTFSTEFLLECKCKRPFSPRYRTIGEYLRVRQDFANELCQRIYEQFANREIRLACIHFGELKTDLIPAIASQMKQRLYQNDLTPLVLWNLECVIQVQDITDVPITHSNMADVSSITDNDLFPSDMPRFPVVINEDENMDESRLIPAATGSTTIMLGGFLATELNPIVNSMRKAKKQVKGMASYADKPAVVCVQVDATLIPSTRFPDYLKLLRFSLASYFEHYKKNWRHISGVEVITEIIGITHVVDGRMILTPYAENILVRNPYADVPLGRLSEIAESDEQIPGVNRYLDFVKADWGIKTSGQAGNDSNVHHPDAEVP